MSAIAVLRLPSVGQAGRILLSPCALIRAPDRIDRSGPAFAGTSNQIKRRQASLTTPYLVRGVATATGAPCHWLRLPTLDGILAYSVAPL